ncbi:tetracycline destructase [Fluoribacter gormanii]|uniref:2-polyprenyl-6-methoxyphenol hydroxylase n=1 Tax=Fluoribacter gormanii TaxID=464 RepID=A0A377GHJ3_9GAMM|nr:tetracycline destructase [Fluoribacter gormanii]KTD01336.1 oxidoreductase [Fluoribacter gormanii]MCW8444168.1 tetracycline destructase [Fluoribacter gormanii]SIR90442.1 2-polyprenyl-6-methoxyphenol hydroxylase [Fluoribacter gormanii]STO24267.1 6-hydroxynicotinate 3-monooxygenase precursor [Fluoribacter gormanii]
MSKDIKILVIGAGIAGPAMCYWLKRFGFSPVLIEKSTAIRKGGQALDVRGVATHIAREMGIYEQICEMRTRIECGRFVDTTGKMLHEEHGEKFGFRQDDEAEILRGDLIEILMKTIADVPCYFNQSIISMQQNADNVTVNFKDGKVENYDIVIGADGIHSATRRMIFDKNEYQLIHLGSYISTFTIPNYLNLSHIDLECEANHKLVSINSDNNPEIARAGFMFRSQHILKDIRNENEQKQFLFDTFRDFGWEAQNILNRIPESDDFYFDAIMQVKMNSWTKGRIALIGDAGYCPSPLSGQGNNLAFVGAYILAGELKAANGDYMQAFTRYNALLRSFVDTNQEFGVWVSKSFLVENEVSKEIAEERSNRVLAMIKSVSNAITLPQYE